MQLHCFSPLSCLLLLMARNYYDCLSNYRHIILSISGVLGEHKLKPDFFFRRPNVLVAHSLHYWASGKRVLSERSAPITSFSHYIVSPCLCLIPKSYSWFQVSPLFFILNLTVKEGTEEFSLFSLQQTTPLCFHTSGIDGDEWGVGCSGELS